MKPTVIAHDAVRKRASEVKKITFNFAEQLAATETISTATITVTAPMTSTNSISGTNVIVVVSSGTAGITYPVRCAITTSQGQVLYLYANVEVLSN